MPVVDCSAAGADALCGAAFGAYSPGGAAVSICVYGCAAGGHCDNRDHIHECYCGDAPCSAALGQICINDGGGEHCVDACLRERTLARACAPISRELPWARLPGIHAFNPSFGDIVHGCRLWAQAFAPPGTHALASTDPVLVNNVVCGMGDTCRGILDPSLGQFPVCTCNGVQCSLDQVCVVDETEGTTDADTSTAHCVPACWPNP